MRTYLRVLLVTGLYLGGAQFAFLAFIQEPGNQDSFEKARLVELVEGTAYRPFVYRTLLPSTVRAILAVLPDSVEAGLTRLAGEYKPLAKLLAATPAADERHPATYLVAYILEFGCLIGFALVLRAGLVHFYEARGWAVDLLPGAALVCLPVFYRYISYDYDLPQLLLFSLGLLLLAKRRWGWFYAVLVLGALNKETTILLVMIHLLGHWKRMGRGALLGHAAAQLLIVAGARGLLQFVLFADNPGAPAERWLGRNWEMISDPGQWTFLFVHFAWVGRTSLIVPTNFNVVFLLLVPLICWRWSDKPVLLRRGLWIGPVLVGLTFFLGFIDEMRGYYEVYPIVFLLIAGSICLPAKSEAEPRG